MEPILTIDNLNSFGGNMLRQGDKSQLKYRLRDVGNKNLNISSKSCEVKMYGRNYTVVVYETTATVSSENTVSFTIDKVLPKGTFYLEFTVGDYIFPTDHREFFEITPSGKGVDANIIEIVGKDVIIREVKSQVDTELQPLVTSLESAQQAELERVTVESSRVSAEEQRKTDHANRSAELDGKADKVVIKNLIENGNFIDGDQIVGIRPINSSRDLLSIENGRLKVTSATYVPDLGFSIRYVTIPKGHKVYLHTSIDYPFSTPQNVVIRATVPSVVTFLDGAYTSGENSQITTTIGDSDGFYFTLNGIKIEVENYYYVNSIMILDLTETFGAGNEPTKEEMDELIKVTGYIDGEYALNNREMLIWTLALIRRNKNAIVALGGA